MRRILIFVLAVCTVLSCVETPPEPTPVVQPSVIVSSDRFGSHSARFVCKVGKTERVFTSGGFYYGHSSDFSDAAKVPGLVLDNEISATVSDLQPDATYYLKAYMVDRYGTVESAAYSFETASFTVSQKEFSLPYEGGLIDLSVVCSEDFLIDFKGVEWISAVGTKNNFPHTREIRIAPNDSFFPREAEIVLSSPDGFFRETVGISQDGAPVLIEDNVLKQYLVSCYDRDNSGEIELNEVPDVTRIEIYSGDIVSLKGIEFFPDLREITCVGPADGGGGIEYIDISHNPKLERIDVSHNRLSSIDVAGCPQLKFLNCSYNQLESLDLASNEPLTDLDCRANRITSLQLENNISLLTVNCDDNMISTLASSRSDALTELSCNRNKLERLDLSNNKKLVSLFCAGNNLSELTIGSPRLVTLDCSSNLLESVPSRKNVDLSFLNCADNRIVTLDLRHNVKLEYLDCSCNGIGMLDLTDNGLLRYLDCHDNPLSTLDVIGLEKLVDLFCNCASMTTLFAEDGQGLEGITVNRSEEHVNEHTLIRSHEGLAVIPDPVFKRHLVQFHDADQDGEISLDEAITITALNICTDSVKSLAGIEYMKGLKYLKCEGSEDGHGMPLGQLTTLDLSANVQLEQLLCERNRLEELDVSQNADLRTLWCFKNRISALDLSNNPRLCDLNCERNLITTLDLTGNPELTSLDCSPMCDNHGENLLVSVYLDAQKIDYVNAKKCRRNVSNIPQQTDLYVGGHSVGFLPERFMFNYNALFFDEASRTFINANEALWPHDMVLNGGGFTLGDGFVHIQKKTYSQWAFADESSNPFNRKGANEDLTIIAKVKGDDPGSFSLFANRGLSGYNYMFREGDVNTRYFYFHDSRSQGSANNITVQTLPNIVIVRVTGNKVWLESYTDHLKGPVIKTSWGSPSKSISFFYGGISGEYWEGDFYWMFLSLNALSDEEIEAVVQFNEK